MSYVEIAIGLPSNRGRLIEYEQLKSYIDDINPLYRSVYMYDDKALPQNRNGEKTLAKYFGPRYIDNILIDIDKGTNTDQYTLDKFRSIIMDLNDLGVPDEAMRPYFSGSGYHLLLHGNLFNFPESDDLPYVVKETMKGLVDNIDFSIYMRTGIYRVAHTMNLKTELYKIPLYWKEVYHATPEDIRVLAQGQRLDFPYADVPFEADGELEQYMKLDITPVRSYKTVNEPSTVATCIHKMFSEGPQEGTRHNTILRIGSHFRRHGIPSTATKAALLEWNNGQLEDQQIISKIENVYNAGYKYGCNDSILKAYCSPKCMYFKRKDYLVDIKTPDDLQKSLQQRMQANFEGKMIDLGKLWGLDPTIDAGVYPGELVTIFGPTGSNKTTLAQNLALGYSASEDCILPDFQLPTLYLSLELSDWYMHRRNLQIVSDLDKETVNKQYNEIFSKHANQLNHVQIQTIPPTIGQIKEKVMELQPSVVYVDYIDLLETPYKDEYSQIKYISHQLRSMAVNMDIIIIQVSQVSRQYSREEILDLYAGKGSGAIENASSKVIGIHGKASSVEKKIEMFKNSDGDLFTVDMQWTPSWRLKRGTV
jgi:KaiC/GvpD/RAD55 family RecA-like ATPase